MLRNLPQVFSAQNASQSNGATGTATLNLRNLGAQRTLTLINGRRLPAGSPLGGGAGADINQIPAALIKNVEVLTGGASATYGSDAIAGVVNFLMVDDFEGIKLDYQFSQSQHDNDSKKWQRIVENAGYETADGSVSDGDTSNVSLLVGKNLPGGRGNVTAYGTYRNIDAVLQGDRDYSSCALRNDRSECAGSATQPQGTFSDFGALRSRGLPGFDYKVEGDQFVPRQGTLFNYGPSNYYQRPDKRWTAGMFAHYDVHRRVEAYTEFMFMKDRSVAQIAPSGSFFRTDTLGCGNPFLSQQQFAALCGAYGLTKDDVQTVYIGRRNVEGGNRQNDLRHTSYRGVFGLRGDLTDTWRYDLHYQYSEVRMQNTYLNDLSITRIKRALDAVEHPETGKTVCRSVLNGSDPDCVPWNIFREGAVTQEMVNYLTLPLSARGATDQTVVSGYIAGNLDKYGLRSPFAATGLDLVLGGEYREENLKFNPDQAYRGGDAAGHGGVVHPVRGGFDVTEFFIEAGVPLLEGAAFAEELRLDTAYRYSDYDYGEQTNTFGARVGWAIDYGIRLRASFQRAVRGPSVRDRFQPQGLGLFDMNADPCSGPVTDGKTAHGRTFEECAPQRRERGPVRHHHRLTGRCQYNFLRGGNPALAPEEADTYSFGLVWTPWFLEGFTFSLDYYSIRIEKGIGTVTPELILNECLDGNSAQCAKVRRGRTGDLWLGSDLDDSGYIVSLLDNAAIEEIQGYDFTAGYDLAIGRWGRLRFNDILSITAMWTSRSCRGRKKCVAPEMGCRLRLSDPGYSEQSACHLADSLGITAQFHVALHQWSQRSQLQPDRSRRTALPRLCRDLELQRIHQYPRRHEQPVRYCTADCWQRSRTEHQREWQHLPRPVRRPGSVLVRRGERRVLLAAPGACLFRIELYSGKYRAAPHPNREPVNTGLHCTHVLATSIASYSYACRSPSRFALSASAEPAWFLRGGLALLACLLIWLFPAFHIATSRR